MPTAKLGASLTANLSSFLPRIGVSVDARKWPVWLSGLFSPINLGIDQFPAASGRTHVLDGASPNNAPSAAV